MKLRNIFSALKPGDVCTGTIMRFGLQSSRLAALGYIVDKNGDWIFCGFGKVKR